MLGLYAVSTTSFLNSHIGNESSWGLNGIDTVFLSFNHTLRGEGKPWFERSTESCHLPKYRLYRQHQSEYVFVLSGDHIYKMDYDDMLHHIN